MDYTSNDKLIRGYYHNKKMLKALKDRYTDNNNIYGLDLKEASKQTINEVHMQNDVSFHEALGRFQMMTMINKYKVMVERAEVILKTIENERQAIVVESRMKGHTFQEIAHMMRVSRQRVHEIYKIALSCG